MTPDEIDTRINIITKQIDLLTEQTGKLHGEHWATAVAHQRALRKRLSALLLQRDKQRRPEVYSKRGRRK